MALFSSSVGNNVARRIVVVGTTGTGKTTVGRQIAQSLNMPFVELDSLHWEPNWTEAPTDVFRERVIEATKVESWVVDGNYSVVRDIVWRKATMLVWLDYPLRTLMWRLFWRTLRRALTGEVLWNGNQERFWTQFFTRDSLFLWALQTYRRRRREYPVHFKQPEYAHLKIVRHRSPKETREWLSKSAVDH